MSECTEAMFLKDVAEHQMTVELDQGVHRSIRFGRPDSGMMHFRLTTWPGHLAFSGDMGTFVFSRLADMFEFFRSKPYKDEKVPIKVGYWMEKCDAQDTHGDGMLEFDPERLRERCKECWEEHFEDRIESDEAKECWSEIESSVLGANPYLTRVHDALAEFDHEGFQFYDAWEWNLTRPTFRMMWCLYAISWGIQQYDAATAPTQATA